MTRLTSDFFVSALLRRLFAEGGLGVVEKRGAPEAGAVHVRVRHSDGTETLLTPAPQAIFDTEKPIDRVFEARKTRVHERDVSQVLARERDFDTDIWIVEIETDQPENYLTISELD